jgi:Domain of unknown function (DUF6362)
MNALDQTTTTRSPASWSADLVRKRLVDAFDIERRLPGQGHKRIASAWPATPLHSWQDKVFWDDARDRVLDSWANAKGAYASEVTAMETAFAWLDWLERDERRCLEGWAFATSRGKSLSRILAKRKLSRSTFYRHRDRAAERIADRLNREGVTVK